MSDKNPFLRILEKRGTETYSSGEQRNKRTSSFKEIREYWKQNVGNIKNLFDKAYTCKDKVDILNRLIVISF